MKIWSGEKVLSQFRIFVCVVLASLVVSGANASPTVTDRVPVLAVSLCQVNVPVATSCAIDSISVPLNAGLADIGREFSQPPANSLDLSNTAVIPVKSLPPLPATILMVLSGFLCVSLVRDRKVWLAVLISLLWAGQTGIQTLPQLVLRLGRKNHIEQQPCAQPAYPYSIENSCRLRSNIEGTRYIGLLRHLAGIPDDENAFTNPHPAKLTISARCCGLYGKVFSYLGEHNRISQLAILLGKYAYSSLLNCLTVKTAQFICFSPAFIFEIIPRGPPNLTREATFS